MKKIVFLLTLLLVGFQFASIGQTKVNVPITITKKIKKDNAKAETQSAVVSHDVLVNGKVAIAAGSPVILSVTHNKPRGFGKPGLIEINCVSTIDINGQVVPLEGGQKSNQGKSRKALMTACTVIFGIVLFPVGLLFMCMKGGKADDIATNTQLISSGTVNM